MTCRLNNTLSQIGLQTQTWKGPDGSTALLLPHGGRILGLFAPASEKNFFWTNPALKSTDSARALFQSTSWHNSGGDRTWLSPEIDFFLPEFPKLTPYVQARQFDPGNYKLNFTGDNFVLKNEFEFALCRSKRTVTIEISKSLWPALNPLRDRSLRDIAYAGFALHTELTVENGHRDPAFVGIWNLLQLPHRGELLVPTFSRSPQVTYFGTIAENDLTITDHLVRYDMNAKGKQKIGFPPECITGRAGYLCRGEVESSLVIRTFTVDPSGQYLDVPWRETGSTACALQACNINGDLGTFSELEYHTPGVGGRAGRFTHLDRSQVWAFRGATSEILKIAHEAGILIVSREINFH